MTDLLLMVIVIGVLLLALAVDLAAVLAWVRSRWRMTATYYGSDKLRRKF